MLNCLFGAIHPDSETKRLVWSWVPRSEVQYVLCMHNSGDLHTPGRPGLDSSRSYDSVVLFLDLGPHSKRGRHSYPCRQVNYHMYQPGKHCARRRHGRGIDS